MKNKILAGLIYAFLNLNSSYAFAANEECIALTNYSSAAVKFDSLVSPGGLPYIVGPKDTAILSRDQMVGSCFGGTCTVIVSDLNGASVSSTIGNLIPGTHIIYGGLNQYYLDKNAHVPCK